MSRTLLDDLDKQELQEQIDDLKENGTGTGTGADGKSAYEIAVDNGFEGTEQEWLDSLVGKTGEQGETGDDGISVTHTWEGTVLTITSASGTSSADLKGEKGDRGEQGIQGETGAQGIQGEKGDTGAAGANGQDGYTPQRDIDYWTEADKDEIVNDIVSKTRIDVIPDYVITEAETVADLILEKMNANCLIGAFVSDIHLETNQTATETSITNAALGINEIRKIVPLDFVVNLGDNCESETSHKFIHKALYNATLGTDGFWLRGNHEGSAYNYSDAEDYEYLVTDDEVYKFVGANNKGHVINADDRKGMYGYEDFEDLRLRVIYLNTSEVFDNNISSENPNISMSTTQIEWLQNAALDFSSKTDVKKWKVLILSHVPLDWNALTQQAVTVLEEYVSSSSGAKIIGNIHGHLHNCNVGTIGTNKIPRFAIPQICADRYNEYSSYGDSYTQWGDFAEDGTTPIYYYKGENNSTDTMFCIVMVDCENEKFYAINFGVTAATTADGSYTKNVRVREISFDGTSNDESEEPTVTLTGISATYTGGEVTAGTALSDLTGIVITATYSDESTANVTGYTLSGTIVEGVNTITVAYGGLTTTFVVTGIKGTGYTNLIPLSIDINGNDYVGNPGGDGYSTGLRFSTSSQSEEPVDGMCITGYIKYENGQTIRLKNITPKGTKTSYLIEYGNSKQYRQVLGFSDIFTIDSNGVYSGTATVSSGYIRICCGVIDETSILTLDEEIT